MRLPYHLLCCAIAIAAVAGGGGCNALLGIEDVVPQRTLTLSQTDSQSITRGMHCGDANGYTLENSFYRRFSLADYGAIDGFTVKSVEFGVYLTSSGVASQGQPLGIYIYNDASPASPTIDLSRLQQRGMVNVAIPDTATPKGLRYEFNPAVAVPGPGLVVELRVAATALPMRKLEIGANLQPQAASAFRRAPACGDEVPVALDTIPNYAMAALVLSVTGDN
jgi:hypothetical protein